MAERTGSPPFAGPSLRSFQTKPLGELAALTLPVFLGGFGGWAFFRPSPEPLVGAAIFCLAVAAAFALRPRQPRRRLGWAAIWAGLIGASPWWAAEIGEGLSWRWPLNPASPFEVPARSDLGVAIAAGVFAFFASTAARWLLPRGGARARRVAANVAYVTLAFVGALSVWGASRAMLVPALGSEPESFMQPLVAGPMPSRSTPCDSAWRNAQGDSERFWCEGGSTEKVNFEVASPHGLRLRRRCGLGATRDGCDVVVCPPSLGVKACEAAPASVSVWEGAPLELYANERLGVGVIVVQGRFDKRPYLTTLPGGEGGERGAIRRILRGHCPPSVWIMAAAYGAALSAWALTLFRRAERRVAELRAGRPATAPGDGWAYPDDGSEPVRLGPEDENVLGSLVVLGAGPRVRSYRNGAREGLRLVEGEAGVLIEAAELEAWTLVLRTIGTAALAAVPLAAWAASSI